MRRRDLLAFVGATAAWPLAGHAQLVPGQHRIAVVASSGPAEKVGETGDAGWRALFSELRRLGYVDGQNLIVERYSAEGHPERHADLARQVIGRDPQLIVVINNFVTGIYARATEPSQLLPTWAIRLRRG